jgi:hypothetical protein
LSIDQDDKEIYSQQLAPEKWDDGYWSDQETNVYLTLISKAIVNQEFGDLKLPAIEECPQFTDYCRGGYPFYSILACQIPHIHSDSCYNLAKAKDLECNSKLKIDHFYKETRRKQRK